MSRERDGEHGADSHEIRRAGLLVKARPNPIPVPTFDVTAVVDLPDGTRMLERSDVTIEATLRALRLADILQPIVFRIGRVRVEVRMKGLGE